MNIGARAGGLRVMIVTDQYEPMVGGVPTVTRELARGLAERGHAVAVIAPSTRTSTSTSGIAAPGVPARPADSMTVTFRGSLRWPWYEGQRLGLLSASAARELIADFAPDVAHVHSPLTLGRAVRSAARRRRVPVVYTNHYLPANVHPTGKAFAGTVFDTVFDTAFYAYLMRFANRCDHVTAPTVTALRLLRDHGLRAPSQAVSNGVDLDAFSPGPGGPPGPPGAGGPPDEELLRRKYGLPGDQPVIVSVGRLSPEKRADVLIEAAARLSSGPGQSGPVLVLAGTGPDSGRLRALAERLGVAPRVRFPGFVPGSDLPGLYRLGDVFAIASEAELQSLVTMEAMASGLPVVAVDAGALRELVHAGENGFLVSPGPTAGQAAALADSLELLCRDRSLRDNMSKASLRIIGTHDRYRVLARWESIYRALAGRGTAEDEVQTKVSDGQP